MHLEAVMEFLLTNVIMPINIHAEVKRESELKQTLFEL
jgi:hypothetical protein